jgi:hypothetical protein
MEPQQQTPVAEEAQILAPSNGAATPAQASQVVLQDTPVRKTSEQRKEALARQIQTVAAQGYRIETQSDFQAIAVRGKPVNHVVHGIASLVTLGLWLIPWLIIAVAGGEKREMISVDEWGNVPVQKL